MNVCVVGLGEIGFSTATYIKDKGLEVWGYDTNSVVVERANLGGLRATSKWHKIPPLDIYLICVSTSLRSDMPDLSSIFDVCEKVSHKAHSSSLVSIESTIVPRVCRKIYEDIFKKSINLIHVPHRYWREDPVKHGVKQLRVFGAVDQESLDIGLKFYRDILDVPLHIVSPIEVAELSKIAENACRYLQIAFAEELRIICEETGLSFSEVRTACNTKWNIEIPEARDGIGGHCLPKDTQHLASLSIYSTLLKSAMVVDKNYREWLMRRGKKSDQIEESTIQVVSYEGESARARSR